MRPEVIYLVTSTKTHEIYAISNYDIAEKKAKDIKGLIKVLYPDSFSMTEQGAIERMLFKCPTYFRGKEKEAVDNSVNKSGEFF